MITNDISLIYEIVDLNKEAHQKAVHDLMNAYMEDPMGINIGLDAKLSKQMQEGLKQQCNYLGILIMDKNKAIGLANCFFGYSTFKAAQLLNIHDFIVLNNHRGKGAGHFLMESVKKEAKNHKCCKVTLEVRNDNPIAQSLYKKQGYTECDPPMYFWQCNIPELSVIK